LSSSVRREANQLRRLSTGNGKDKSASIIASYHPSVYEVEKEDTVSMVLDSPVTKVFHLMTNPIALVLALYFSINGYNKFNEIAAFFRKRSKSAKEGEGGVQEALPYQVFECESCEMQMRPARGRADKIFGRERLIDISKTNCD
jgi:hypothetical protein